MKTRLGERVARVYFKGGNNLNLKRKSFLAVIMTFVFVIASATSAFAGDKMACYSTWRDILQNDGSYVTKSCLAVHSPNWKPTGDQITIYYDGTIVTQGDVSVKVAELDYTSDGWYYYGIATRFRTAHPFWDTDGNWEVYRN